MVIICVILIHIIANQFCTAEDQLVYHTDSQTYAAVVFLTPDAPAECGTSFFKHKANGLRKYPTDADCKKFNIVDDIIPEPFGGAHRHPIKQAEILKQKIVQTSI